MLPKAVLSMGAAGRVSQLLSDEVFWEPPLALSQGAFRKLYKCK